MIYELLTIAQFYHD